MVAERAGEPAQRSIPEFSPPPSGWSWSPIQPTQYLRVQLDDEPWEIFIVTKVAGETEDAITYNASGIGVVLDDYPLPFRPPGSHGLDFARLAAFAHHWRRIHYVFRMAEPRSMPRLSSPLSTDDQREVLRFVQTTHELASSTILRGDEATWYSISPTEGVKFEFPGKMMQAGFTVVLRQCTEGTERASFARVRKILSAAYNRSGDSRAIAILRDWKRFESRMRATAFEDLLWDALVARQGWTPQERRRRPKPDDLLDRYRYQDLIHYGTPGEVDLDSAGRHAARDRFDFLSASTALAHLYVGFGELASTAIGVDPQITAPAARP